MNTVDFKAVARARAAAGVALVVRLCADRELEKFKELMTTHHYLKGGRSAGDTLRYVAESGGEWVALLTWGAAAYKLKHREAWIGWGIGLRRARLKLVVQNRRFCLLLKPGEAPNLASQVLGACLRRLRADWFAAFGYRPLFSALTATGTGPVPGGSVRNSDCLGGVGGSGVPFGRFSGRFSGFQAAWSTVPRWKRCLRL